MSKGFGFVSFDSFEAADLAIECMHGQFLCNRAIVCQYAFKKESKGERHGSQVIFVQHFVVSVGSYISHGRRRGC